MTLLDAISRFGLEAGSRLSNRGARDAPEDQSRAPLEALVSNLAEFAGLLPEPPVEHALHEAAPAEPSGSGGRRVRLVVDQGGAEQFEAPNRMAEPDLSLSPLNCVFDRTHDGSVAKSGWLVTCLRDLQRGVEA